MDALTLIHPVPAAWLRDSALAPFVPAYRQSLVEHRYAAGTTRQYLCGIAHFARWMRRHRLAVSALDEDVVQRFLDEHLPRCTCPAPVQRSRHQIHAALRHLLVLLENAGALSSAHVPTAVEEELRRFGEYMEHARGLAQNTRIQRLNILRPFLRKNGSVNLHKWTAPTAADLRRFIALQLQRWSPASANALAGALRCYLRFRAMCGDPVEHLLPVIASPANWRLAPLPQTLSQSEVTQSARAILAVALIMRTGRARADSRHRETTGELVRPTSHKNRLHIISAQGDRPNDVLHRIVVDG